MTPVFADTFFFLALLNAQDHAHLKALAANTLDRPVITSDFVLLELADHLCDIQNRSLFGDVVDALKSDARYEIVAVDPLNLNDAQNLYRSRPDKSWSLTDCTSFILMQQHKITEALSGDHHFNQAGFTALLV